MRNEKQKAKECRIARDRNNWGKHIEDEEGKKKVMTRSERIRYFNDKHKKGKRKVIKWKV